MLPFLSCLSCYLFDYLFDCYANHSKYCFIILIYLHTYIMHIKVTTAFTVCTALLTPSSGTTSIFFEGVDNASSMLIRATSRSTCTITINALNTSLLLPLKVLLLQRLLRLLMLILLLLIIHELLLFIRLLLLLLIQLLLLLLLVLPLLQLRLLKLQLFLRYYYYFHYYYYFCNYFFNITITTSTTTS